MSYRWHTMKDHHKNKNKKWISIAQMSVQIHNIGFPKVSWQIKLKSGLKITNFPIDFDYKINPHWRIYLRAYNHFKSVITEFSKDCWVQKYPKNS